MYAVFINGGKQYKVKIGQTLRLEKINSKSGSLINFNKVLLLKKNNKTFLGNPILKNTIVQAKIFSHGREKKIQIIKFNRRKHYKKKQGHRQNYTSVKIINIKHNKEIKNGT
ncbi:MAG: 50S ribosomal protein L21 [Buchnera aphidicola (Periphyllus lyropictus)]|uniref:50S ribosomal protein L21 n=1 Tax=Buchnera aphidicola TaxID=9 RepID=UPI001ECC62B8|nr:50S ribosomal protein L21 [Buchnera aphidicola]NIH16568.1 50S ribosomal protein L21 [Buchnera aphidicola (Periphyllus lyropictus)]USS94458.1 50S ribosomal protein L21 [Buchnera aphidicola (Periphyllus lyropictus)]